MTPTRADTIQAGDLVLMNRCGVAVFCQVDYVVVAEGIHFLHTDQVVQMYQPTDLLAVVRP